MRSARLAAHRTCLQRPPRIFRETLRYVMGGGEGRGNSSPRGGYMVNFGGCMILCIHFTTTATIIYNNCSNLDESLDEKEKNLKK